MWLLAAARRAPLLARRGRAFAVAARERWDSGGAGLFTVPPAIMLVSLFYLVVPSLFYAVADVCTGARGRLFFVAVACALIAHAFYWFVLPAHFDLAGVLNHRHKT